MNVPNRVSAFARAMIGRPAAVVPVPAVGAVVPALTLKTGKPFAVVLRAAVKLAGCAVVRVVYGPNALADGHRAFQCERPNVLTGQCLALSAVMAPLGRRAYRAAAPGV